MSELVFDDYNPTELLDAEVLVVANDLTGTIKGFSVYSNSDDHALVRYTNTVGTIITEWIPVSDLELVEVFA